MFIIQNYTLAVIFCIITMLCWGSWANTQKLVQNEWRFELFYWDYVLGILFFSLVAAFTLGSFGVNGRDFLSDLSQADFKNIQSAFIGGVVFNLANILLTAAIAGAGMSVAFPIGIGIALVLGVLLNYFLIKNGDPVLLFIGVALVTIAIVLNAFAYGQKSQNSTRASVKWIIVSIVAGVLMSSFYRFIAVSMDLENFVTPATGKMTPYSAFVIFSLGIFGSNFIFNSVIMKRPLEGPALTYSDYFRGGPRVHLVGLLGGSIWAIGNLFNLIAAGKAGPAISYGLGQGATLVAALWGVLVWKEFKNAPPGVMKLLTGMFLLFVLGLGLIIYSGAT